MKRPALMRLAFGIAPEAEEAAAVLVEKLFDATPAIYTDAETGETTVMCYVEKRRWRKSSADELQAALLSLHHFGLHTGPVKLEIGSIRHEHWAESWKRHFKPIDIAGTLLIKPSWSKRCPRKGQAVVILDPGLSFGTGQHATTAFCLEQIVACRQPGIRQSFLDIGTGSGILAIAAAKLGYSPVRAFDFDPEAVRVARSNVSVNKIDKLVRPVCRDLRQLPLSSPVQFDLVCANLIANLLIEQAKRIVHRVKPGGHLVLAGILAREFDGVRKRYEGLGLKLEKTAILREWQSACFLVGRSRCS